MGKDGRKGTRKVATALVQAGDEPRQVLMGTAQGRGDVSSDQIGGDRAGKEEFESS